MSRNGPASPLVSPTGLTSWVARPNWWGSWVQPVGCDWVAWRIFPGQRGTSLQPNRTQPHPTAPNQRRGTTQLPRPLPVRQGSGWVLTGNQSNEEVK